MTPHDVGAPVVPRWRCGGLGDDDASESGHWLLRGDVHRTPQADPRPCARARDRWSMRGWHGLEPPTGVPIGQRAVKACDAQCGIALNSTMRSRTKSALLRQLSQLSNVGVSMHVYMHTCSDVHRCRHVYVRICTYTCVHICTAHCEEARGKGTSSTAVLKCTEKERIGCPSGHCKAPGIRPIHFDSSTARVSDIRCPLFS